MKNLSLITEVDHWRVIVIRAVAKMLGITIHIEGIPFGSARNMRFTPNEQSPRV